MEKDPFLSEELCDKNVIESVSGISSVYTNYNEGNMFAGSNGDDPFFSEEYKQPSVPNLKDKQARMKEKSLLSGKLTCGGSSYSLMWMISMHAGQYCCIT